MRTNQKGKPDQTDHPTTKSKQLNHVPSTTPFPTTDPAAHPRHAKTNPMTPVISITDSPKQPHDQVEQKNTLDETNTQRICPGPHKTHDQTQTRKKVIHATKTRQDQNKYETPSKTDNTTHKKPKSRSRKPKVKKPE
mmetsp:Transcript_17975/g.27475  ORF Transcript_17975/g.27475 Transcript_17975/m.27475 type:complete len:137 (-) Transcript_17975:44-454(-)